MNSGIKKTWLGLSLALASTVALAAVTFDSATGFGFVGKGDVQTPFGWNNAVLQTNAAGVFFTYEATTSYEAMCTFTMLEGTHHEHVHNIDHTIGLGVASTVAATPRKNSQNVVTGFNLTEFSGTSFESGGSVPVVGGPCVATGGHAGHPGLWSSVTQTGAGEGGLYANYGTTLKALIWQ